MLLHCLPFTFLLLFTCLLTPHVLNVETGVLHADDSGPPSPWWGGPPGIDKEFGLSI